MLVLSKINIAIFAFIIFFAFCSFVNSFSFIFAQKVGIWLLFVGKIADFLFFTKNEPFVATGGVVISAALIVILLFIFFFLFSIRFYDKKLNTTVKNIVIYLIIFYFIISFFNAYTFFSLDYVAENIFYIFLSAIYYFFVSLFLFSPFIFLEQISVYYIMFSYIFSLFIFLFLKTKFNKRSLDVKQVSIRVENMKNFQVFTQSHKEKLSNEFILKKHSVI